MGNPQEYVWRIKNDVWNNMWQTSSLQHVMQQHVVRKRVGGITLCECKCDSGQIRVCESSSWFMSHTIRGKGNSKGQEELTDSSAHTNNIYVNEGIKQRLINNLSTPCPWNHFRARWRTEQARKNVLHFFISDTLLPSLSSPSSPLMPLGCVSNLAACFTSHTDPVQNSFRSSDRWAAFLLAVPYQRPQQCHSNHLCSL